MAYYGRILGLGLTEEQRPIAVYGLTGRSPSSKQRVARIIDGEFIPKIKIESHGTPDPKQLSQGNLLFYDAIVAFNNLQDGNPYLAISNGCHTNHFADRTAAWPFKEHSLEKALEAMGYEPDSLRTPRIAGEIIFHKKIHNCPVARVGIITENQSVSKLFILNQHDIGAGEGGVKIISTYSGENDEKPEAPFWNGSLEDLTQSVPLDGNTAQEIASAFYETLDEKYRVSAAAALWNGKSWELAVKNLHGVE